MLLKENYYTFLEDIKSTAKEIVLYSKLGRFNKINISVLPRLVMSLLQS